MENNLMMLVLLAATSIPLFTMSATFAWMAWQIHKIGEERREAFRRIDEEYRKLM